MIGKHYIKIVFAILFIVFIVFIYVEIDRNTIIPDHLHSIDDKSPEERTTEDSITIFERSLQKEPGNIDIKLQLSVLYIKTRRVTLARKKLLEILETEPSNTEAIKLIKQVQVNN